MTYNIIATGSTGNAVILNSEILIDCGVPYKEIQPYKDSLKLVLLTHEHGDHFKPATVRTLAKERPGLRWGCCEWMVQHLLDAGVKKKQIDVLLPEFFSIYQCGGVAPVPLHHNVPNCGYRIDTDTGTAFYATDTGTLDGIVAKGYDLYLVECNHSRAELEERAAEKEAAGEYAYEREAAQNHLSQEQAIDWLIENMDHNGIWVPLHGHVVKKKKEAIDEQV